MMEFFSYREYEPGDIIKISPCEYICNAFDWEFLSELISVPRENPVFIIVYTFILIITWLLTTVSHISIVEWLFSVATTSLFLIVYLAFILFRFEKSIKFKVLDSHNCYSKKRIDIEPINKKSWQLSVWWSILLFLILSASFYFIKNYANDYEYGCMDVYQEENANLYHYRKSCTEIQSDTEKVQAYKALENGCKLCPACEEWAEDVSSEYDKSVPSRYL